MCINKVYNFIFIYCIKDHNLPLLKYSPSSFSLVLKLSQIFPKTLTLAAQQNTLPGNHLSCYVDLTNTP